MNKTFIIFDLEATCYDRNNTTEDKPIGFRNEIIEIGAYKIDNNGKIIDSFSKFLKPKKFPHISNFCNSLTTIKQSDIDNAENAKDVLDEFFDWAGNSTFVSWGHYDKRQLQDDLKLNGLDKELINDDNHYSLKHLYGEWNNIKPVGTGYALKLEKMQFDGIPHRGIDDAKNISKIFIKYLHKFI